MKKDEKESEWPFYQPASFRHWTKRNMNPVSVQGAIKTKQKIAFFYLISATVAFHLIVYERFFKKREISTVENDIDPVLNDYLTISQTDETKAKIFTFDQFKLKSVEHFDQKEWEKARREA